MSASRRKSLAASTSNLLEVLFAIILTQLIAHGLCNSGDEFEGFLLCRQCGLEVTRSDSLLNVPSVRAHRQRNDTLSGTRGVLIQLFKNPDGKYFEVISSAKAEVQKMNQRYSEHSWFPGFSWTVAVCPRCGQHLGWIFEPAPPSSPMGAEESQTQRRDSFVGLILGNLLHEQEAESIIAVPKTYHS